MNWLNLWWWQYLLAPKDPDVSWYTAIRCRMQGHPCGVVWFNHGGTEPDMHCKVCGDDFS